MPNYFKGKWETNLMEFNGMVIMKCYENGYKSYEVSYENEVKLTSLLDFIHHFIVSPL